MTLYSCILVFLAKERLDLNVLRNTGGIQDYESCILVKYLLIELDYDNEDSDSFLIGTGPKGVMITQ